MKKILFLLLGIWMTVDLSAQTSSNPMIGTWEYCNNDTIFRIKLIAGREISNGIVRSSVSNIYPLIFGGYSLTVNGVLVDDYIKNISLPWNVYTPAPNNHIYIIGTQTGNLYINFEFYDQRKLHNNGKGYLGGVIDLISTNQIHWQLDEMVGRFQAYEGDYTEGEDPVIPPLIGFSVPADVIMTRVSTGEENGSETDTIPPPPPPEDSPSGPPPIE